MILTREQFIAEIDEILRLRGGSCAAIGHPVWIPEQEASIKCNYFVCIQPIVGSSEHAFHEEYWDWVDNTLQGQTRCFCTNAGAEEEWWGFTEEADVVIFLLRWSK